MQHKFVQRAVVSDDTLGDRQVRVIASDPTVDWVGDILVPDGCDLDAYLRNNIVLADHDARKAVGNAEINITPERVEALITFAPAGISAQADEYCGLYKSGVLKGVSVGFEPIDYHPIDGGGIRYDKWALLELSCVAVPANPNAVTVARSMEKREMQQKDSSWKVGASRSLPLDMDSSWDAAAAQKSIFDAYGFDGDKPDTGRARKGFLFYDASQPKLRGSYKEPFAKVAGGRLTAVASGIRAAASRLGATDVPDEIKTLGRAVLDHYESKMQDKHITDEDLCRAIAALSQEKLKMLLGKVGRVLSAANVEHLKNIGACIKGMNDCASKAADLHDLLHDNLVDMMDHGTSAGEHVKAVLDSCDGNANGNDDDIEDPTDSDQELSRQSSARKRQVEVLERSSSN